MPSLIVTSGALAGQVFGFTDTAVVGRGQFSEVRLNDPTVSRRHALIRHNAGNWEVSDQDSANGTLLRGAKLAGTAVLSDGDSLCFGEVMAVFHIADIDRPSLRAGALKSDPGNKLRSRTGNRAAAGALSLGDLLARLKLFCDIGALSRRALDLHTTLDEALRALLAAFAQASLAAVYVTDAGRQSLKRVAHHVRPGGGDGFAKAASFVRDALNIEYGIEIADDEARKELAACLKAASVPAALLAIPLRLGGETLGALYLESATAANAWQAADRELFAGVAGQLAWLVASQQAQSPERLVEAHDLALARRIQQRFLPQSAPVLKGWRFADSYAAARVIGGDYFDYIHYSDGRHGIVIADVSGKAVSGALYMARLSAQVRVLARSLAGPDELLVGLNRKLAQELEPGMFVTMLAAALDPDSGKFEFANAGHPAPLLREPDGSVREIGEHGALPLGAMPDTSFPLYAATIAPGACLLLYTDGLDEAHDAAQNLFGKERVTQTLAGAGERAQGALDAQLAQVARFTDGQAQSDDLTLIAISRDRKR